MYRNKTTFKSIDKKIILHFFDAFFVLLTLYAFGRFFETNYLSEIVSNLKNTAMFVFYLHFFGSIFELYNIQIANHEFKVLKSITLTVSSTVLVYMLTPVFTPVLPSNRLQILAFFLLFFISLYLWRLFYLKFLSVNFFLQNAVLICDQAEAEELIGDFENIDPNYKIIGYVATNAVFQNSKPFATYIEREGLAQFIKTNKVSEIVIATKTTADITPNLYRQLLQLLESGIIIKEYNKVYESKSQRIPVQYIAKDFYRLFPFSENQNNLLYLTLIGLFDYVFSLIGLLFGIVLLPLILIGNLIGNRGPLFYTQTRIGKNGLPFEIMKLRTMVKNAETQGAVFATPNDSRITAFGKFLRKTRIDEIPQFLNILRGEMAIIGPRPERPEIVNQIIINMPIYETRHVMKPGITGWAQVNYSYGENIEDSLVKLQYDLYYIKNRSIHLDLSIAIKTITTVLFYRGQ